MSNGIGTVRKRAGRYRKNCESGRKDQEGKKLTEYTEYMETLKEQIQNKRARVLVEEEIRGHIEEQEKEYLAEGMEEEEAKREAVRQMGDPVETGCALNRIHRPAFPWKLFALAVFLTGASMLISLIISAKANEGAVQAEQVGSLLVVNAVSFAMIFVIMYFDYTWLFLHIRAVYTLYMICLCLVWSGGISGNYQTSLLACYSVQALLPVLFAGMMYRYRGKGVQGILKSVGWIIIPFMVLSFISLPISNGAVVENAVVCLFLLIAAVLRGIFGNEKKKYLTGLALLVTCILGVVAVFFHQFLTGGYVLARLTHTGQFGYQNKMIVDAVQEYSLFGNRTFLMYGTRQDGEYLLGNIFSYFGIIAGILVVAAFVWFLIHAFRESFMQSNRMGFLLGMACSIGLAVRVLVIYNMVNFGYGVIYTVAVPFFSTNVILAAVNGIYVGLLFCVLRNKMILKEPHMEKKKVTV